MTEFFRKNNRTGGVSKISHTCFFFQVRMCKTKNSIIIELFAVCFSENYLKDATEEYQKHL